MFSLFPILGITQGFIPIAAYNYGANYKKRVEEVIRTALIYASGFATLVFLLIYFFSNSIAIIFTDIDGENYVNAVYGANEIRNKEIIKRMYDVIEKNYNIVIWPEDIQLKDVNEMIMNGMSTSKVEDIISRNTYNKLSALTKLSIWKKV